jgi:hypothetical protein
MDLVTICPFDHCFGLVSNIPYTVSSYGSHPFYLTIVPYNLDIYISVIGGVTVANETLDP